MRQTEQALCYWPRPGAPEAAAARRALAAMKVRVRPAGPEDTGRTIGALFAGKGEEPAPPGEPVPDPVLVLSGFTSARLQALLLALQRQGVPRGVFKAVLTPDNAGWTLHQLWRELSREREAIAKGQRESHDAPAT